MLPVETLCDAKMRRFSVDLKEIDWRNGLIKMQKYRLEKKLSMKMFFKILRRKNVTTMPKSVFADGLTTACPDITLSEAISLSNMLDSKHNSGYISVGDMIRFVNIHCDIWKQTASRPLPHECFPPWLTQRKDFQSIAIGDDNTMENWPVYAAASVPKDRRKPADLRIIFKWLRQNQFLCKIPGERLMEICKEMILVELPADSVVVRQGDISENYYMIISGAVQVIKDELPIAELHAAFGEKALEHDEPRTATVLTLMSTKFLVLKANDIKNIVTTLKSGVADDIATFLRSQCSYFRNLSFQKIMYIARRVTEFNYLDVKQAIVQQNDKSYGLYFIKRGKVAVARTFRVHDLIDSDTHTADHRIGDIQMTVLVAVLGEGRDFGDDCLRGKRCMSQSYSAATSNVEILFLNSNDAQSAFNTETESFKLLKQSTAALHVDNQTLVMNRKDKIIQKLQEQRELKLAEERRRSSRMRLLKGLHSQNSVRSATAAMRSTSARTIVPEL